MSLSLQGPNALALGQRRKAKELYQSELEMARQKGTPGAQSLNPAVIDALVGDCEAIRKAKLPFWSCMDGSAVRLAVDAVARNSPANPNNLGLLFLRGWADQKTGQGAEAAVEFQKSLTTRAGTGDHSIRSPIWAWLAGKRWRATLPKPGEPTRTSSPSGKTPTRMFRSWFKPPRN